MHVPALSLAQRAGVGVGVGKLFADLLLMLQARCRAERSWRGEVEA